MNENSNRRRAWVKNAIIIFLAIMLILTFFSNTIMNYSLPEVAAQYAQNGSITSKIRTTASVKANSTKKVTIDESRIVSAVAVRDGDTVEIGDVLFYLDDAESSQLTQARETLAALEKQYKLKQLEAGEDYYSDELAIYNKQKELEKAKQALTDVEANAALLESLNAELKTLADEQKALTKRISAYQTQIAKLQSQAADESFEGVPTADRIAAATEKYEAAKSAYETAEAEKESTALALERAEDAYEAANEKYEAMNPDSSLSASALTEQINTLNKTIRRYKEDYQIKLAAINKAIDDAYNDWVQADYAYNNALYLLNQGMGSQEAVDRWYERSETARLNYESILESNKPQKDAAKLEYDRQMEDYTEQLEKLQAQLDSIAGTEEARAALDQAKKNKTSATTAAADASEAYDKAKTDYTERTAELKALEMLAKLEECQSTMDELSAQSEALADTIEEKTAEKQELSSGIVDVDAQNERIEALAQELSTLQHNLSARKQEAARQDKIEQIELDELIENINKQRELVEKYEANSVDAKITAPIAGQITSVSAVVGSETSIGQTLCEIVVTDLGYSCEVSLTNEQSKRVRVGDEVTISNNWWSSIKGNIVSLNNDPKNPGQSKIAVIALTGDVVVGQSLNLTIGEKGQNYDTVIPNSAVREDNNGKFVLVVEAKSSPLGNRYIARRYDVSVLASDDTNSAVSGLMGSEFIITTSTKPIAAGDQVRMAENSK